MAKRVLIFSLAYYPSHISGAEIAVKEITDRISPEEIEFSMITHRFDRSAPASEWLGRVLVHRVGFGPTYLSKIFFIPLAAWKAASLYRTKPFDAYWAMMTYMLFPLVLAKIFGMRGPYVLTLQDGDPYEKVFGRWFIRPVTPILDWGFRHATRVQTISNYLATWPRQRGYKYAVEVIPNGASVESSQEFSPEEIDVLKNKLGKKEGDIYLLSIGRLVYQKAIDDVVRALVLLPQQVQLVVVGDGPDKDALVALAQKVGVAARVKFVGRVTRDETAKYRAVCDIFVLPSRSEGQGISFLSSMLAGLPVITTQEGGIADFLFDAKRNPESPTTGWAVNKDSPEQIADAIQDILAHPNKVTEVTATARRMVVERYNWDTIEKDMKNKVFLKAIGEDIAK